MHSKLLLHALQHFGVGKCPLQKKWSEQLPTPKKLEWVVVHSKDLVEFCALQFFWSGLWVHSKFFGVDLKCTTKILEWTWGALQNFSSGLQVHSKFLEWTLSAWFLLQGSEKFWSGKLYTPNILEWTASHSKKIGVHTFPLQIGVHEVKCWSAFSLTLYLWFI